jgi:pyridoxal phosphate phosphatase PHOSPHO2
VQGCVLYTSAFSTNLQTYSSGDELDAFIKRHAPAFDRVVYVGDGSNDFCPVLRLRRYILSLEALRIFSIFTFSLSTFSQDMVLCRRQRGLQKRITEEGQKQGLKCQVKYWAGAWEVEEIFGNF